jgi:hypothetical protein
VAAVLDQREKYLKDFRGERDNVAVAQQYALPHVHAEATELVKVPGWLTHRPL